MVASKSRGPSTERIQHARPTGLGSRSEAFRSMVRSRNGHRLVENKGGAHRLGPGGEPAAIDNLEVARRLAMAGSAAPRPRPGLERTARRSVAEDDHWGECVALYRFGDHPRRAQRVRAAIMSLVTWIAEAPRVQRGGQCAEHNRLGTLLTDQQHGHSVPCCSFQCTASSMSTSLTRHETAPGGPYATCDPWDPSVGLPYPCGAPRSRVKAICFSPAVSGLRLAGTMTSISHLSSEGIQQE